MCRTPPWASGSGGPSQVQQPNLPLAGPRCGTTLTVPVQVPIHLQGPVVAPYPHHFCFQEPTSSASGGMYSTLSALTRRTHRDALAYCILSDLLPCTVGIKSLLSVLRKVSWQCLRAGWCTHAMGIASPPSLQGRPEVPWGPSGSGGPLPVVIRPKFARVSPTPIVLCSGT